MFLQQQRQQRQQLPEIKSKQAEGTNKKRNAAHERPPTASVRAICYGPRELGQLSGSEPATK